MARFGTDGIRGVANAGLDAELVLAVGRAVAIACRDGVLGRADARPSVVVGRDTRVSGDMLEGAVVAGLASGGADVLLAGVLPTPGVAHLTAETGASAGVVLSASHNPVPDNGVKVFASGGWKLDAGAQDALESLLASAGAGALPTGAAVGRTHRLGDAEDRYVAHLCESGAALGGLRVVADCADGAAHRVAPRVLRELGARVTAMRADGDGTRINDGCGATHPEAVAAVAAAAGALGLSFDGDADRVLAADESGVVVDGDAIVAILARAMRDAGSLPGGAVAVTVMSNQSMRAWCAAQGIGLVETPVGDRHVLQAMRERGLALGGEQSGHVIRLDRATTGDGVLTAVGLLEAVVRGGGRLEDVVPFRPLPQALVNVGVASASAPAGDGPVARAVDTERAVLGESGRVLVRPSGTEPVVRVMVEAPTDEAAAAAAGRIAAAVREEMGSP